MDWFKIWPSSYLNVINRITDGNQRAAFSLLIFHCLNDGSLPDDDGEIAYISGLSVELVESLRPHLKRLARIEEGRIIILMAEDTIRERKDFAEKKALAGQSGGKQKEANKEVKHLKLAKPSTASETEAQLSKPIRPEAMPSQTDKHADMHTNKGNPPAISDEPSPIFAALENIYPGHATNFRTMSELFSLTEKLSATLAQVENFPRWLEEKHPKKANSPFAFKDLFADSIKNGNASPQSEPARKFKCARCQDSTSITVKTDTGVRYVDCPACQPTEAA